MELLPDIPVFQFNNNVLNLVRKQYGLEKKETLEDSIDHLAEWIKKQDHFMKKDFLLTYQGCRALNGTLMLHLVARVDKLKLTGVYFEYFEYGANFIQIESRERTVMKFCNEVRIYNTDKAREYLERTIILSKGSLEKSKQKLDKICTFRTLLPIFFQTFDIENCQLLKDIKVYFLPKMTKDHYRVFMFKNNGQRFDYGFLDFFRYVIRSSEFIQAHDYCTGVIGVFDYTEANLLEVLKSLNLIELQQLFSLVIQGYGMRLKSLHFLTTSKAVDILIGLIKQVVSPKIGDRIKVHKSIEGVCDEFLPKEMLPSDYGGKEKSIDELQLDMKKALFSTNFNEYFNSMKEARTNEALRSEVKFNNECMGMPGSFRTLNVD